MFGRIARVQASRLVGSTHVVSMPNFFAIWSSSGTTVPKTPRAVTMWSPAFSRPNTIVVIAAMPVAGGHARLGAFERGQPVLEHAHRGVGEARVDVVFRRGVRELARGLGGALVDEARA